MAPSPFARLILQIIYKILGLVDGEHMARGCYEFGQIEGRRAWTGSNVENARPRSDPSELPVIEERLARFQAEFRAGANWACGIFLRSSGEVLGGVSLLARIGPGALELGYWLRNECTGRGYATEAAAALTQVGLAMPGIGRKRSASVPL